MTLNGSARPDVDAVLGTLKDFQRDTVEYVFRRLYVDPDRVSRFLIADEVGLGKTLVARGVIATAIDYLWEKIPRLDVVYICSNQEIAQQNIDRLNITADRRFQFASRATLLPITLQELRGNKLNFVSLTPGTSFELRPQAGWQRERAVLYVLLRDHWRVPDGTLRNVLRGRVRRESWHGYLQWFERDVEPQLDDELRQAFYKVLDETPTLFEQYEAVAEQIGGRRVHLTNEMRSVRNSLIGQLRHLLARSSLGALEPDLVILDEFQRFKHLLDDRHHAGLLAQELFGFADAKILLLSATPYKMYALEGEEGEDHYGDFLDTVRFLLQGRPVGLRRLEQAIGRYRDAMFRLTSEEQSELRDAKLAIEDVLRHVMVRTERLAASADRNGMLAERLVAQDQVHPSDIEGFVHLDQIARAIDAGDQVEYWKSAAYPLNLMDRYKLKDQLAAALGGPQARHLNELLSAAHCHLLSWDDIQSYRTLDPGNARLRALWQDSVETGNWQLLWIPPALPYYQPAGPYRDVQAEGSTKSLVFSSWRLVPKTIAILLSYEAERRMLEPTDRDFAYDDLTRRRKSLLTFALKEERLAGMPVLCLLYPCLTLASAVDPLLTSSKLMDGELPSWDEVFAAARAQVDVLLRQATSSLRVRKRGRQDEGWYWGALALLDRHFHRRVARDWLSSADESLGWASMLAGDEEGGAGRFAEHVAAYTNFFNKPSSLGPQPSDLVDVLTYIALSAPATVTLRSMLRVLQDPVAAHGTAFMGSAARAAVGFRSLFSQPESISLLQGLHPDVPYWQGVLRYCSDGNLQAVMDEYLHVLHESLGLMGHDTAESAEKLGNTIHQALTVKAPSLRFDEIIPGGQDGPPAMYSRGIRCRYALRFGDERTEDDERTRGVDVRVSFNSPFRPFVLATTSVGQEGLDFHQYCHRVVHWNLPSNPVDLEQREGRVHRYKGHVIRRNLAATYGLSEIQTHSGLVDPWQQIFARAVADRSPDANDLVPFWVCELPADQSADQVHKIERVVPVLPLSREVGRIRQLKRSLIAYRSVIGQPRQQELVEFLSAYLDEGEIQDLVGAVAIDLSPPKRREDPPSSSAT